MRIDVTGNGYAKARLWIDELPGGGNLAEVDDSPLFVKSLSKKKVVISKCCAELYVPMGGMIAYGRLGARYSQEIGTDLLAICIASNSISLNNGSDLLAPSFDSIQLGLSAEMKDALLDYLIKDKSKFLDIFPGRLQFGWAVQSAVGTSVWTIHLLADAIYWLLSLPVPQVGEEEARAAFDDRFQLL